MKYIYKKHNEENINLVIVLLFDKFHQYCMQLHKYTKNNFKKIVHIIKNMTDTSVHFKKQLIACSVVYVVTLSLHKNTTLIVLAMKTANC